MAGKTTNYGWTKPEANDWLEIGVISEVFEQIDAQMKNVEDEIILIEKGGTGATTAEEALMNLGGLPLTGGTLTGELNINSDSKGLVFTSSIGGWNAIVRESSGNTQIRSDDSEENTTFNIRPTVANDTVHFWYDRTSKYCLFGEHNKPSGTYTGNGDATSREFQVAADGNLLILGSYDKYIGIVYPFGAVFFYTNSTSGSVKYFPNSVIWYQAGKLKITSSDAVINKSGTSYFYKAL